MLSAEVCSIEISTRTTNSWAFGSLPNSDQSAVSGEGVPNTSRTARPRAQAGGGGVEDARAKTPELGSDKCTPHCFSRQRMTKCSRTPPELSNIYLNATARLAPSVTPMKHGGKDARLGRTFTGKLGFPRDTRQRRNKPLKSTTQSSLTERGDGISIPFRVAYTIQHERQHDARDACSTQDAYCLNRQPSNGNP